MLNSFKREIIISVQTLLLCIRTTNFVLPRLDQTCLQRSKLAAFFITLKYIVYLLNFTIHCSSFIIVMYCLYKLRRYILMNLTIIIQYKITLNPFNIDRRYDVTSAHCNKILVPMNFILAERLMVTLSWQIASSIYSIELLGTVFFCNLFTFPPAGPILHTHPSPLLVAEIHTNTYPQKLFSTAIPKSSTRQEWFNIKWCWRRSKKNSTCTFTTIDFITKTL